MASCQHSLSAAIIEMHGVTHLVLWSWRCASPFGAVFPFSVSASRARLETRVLSRPLPISPPLQRSTLRRRQASPRPPIPAAWLTKPWPQCESIHCQPCSVKSFSRGEDASKTGADRSNPFGSRPRWPSDFSASCQRIASPAAREPAPSAGDRPWHRIRPISCIVLDLQCRYRFGIAGCGKRSIATQAHRQWPGRSDCGRVHGQSAWGCHLPWLQRLASSVRTREWMGPGGPLGLQNRCAPIASGWVGSTPMHSRQIRNPCREGADREICALVYC